ncbi:seryl-tRNA synthetase [Croceifilum oryzae]|uniref:Seryl-tRNA synthetase n=1 Tax=Croceifilum oryzae TaxID=1553429 RepID=A0AAJ1WSQ4_9BACL|nr:aminoacyl--tRNA ligase-related protein [Croceifilum oryzae]MDQ0417970.1 seryl-tRNA synthetase [Croceifilum oryzae]
MELRFAFENKLRKNQIESLYSKLIYSIEGIINCRFQEETEEIVVEFEDPSLVESIHQVVNRLIEEEKKMRTISPRILKKTSSPIDVISHDASIHSIFSSDGAVCKDSAISLFEALDQKFLNIAVQRGAHLRKYTSMIASEALEKCQYINSFPQNVFLVSEFPHQLEILEKVREGQSYDELARVKPYVLTPAVCFHCYEELSDQKLDQPIILTSKGNCFRHEATWRVGNHRLNEFQMREIVFMGDKEFVESLRQSILEEVWQLFESLGLQGRVETANDPFYFSQDAYKKNYQLMSDIKYELIVELAEKSAFSIASFNNVRDTLCQQFHITSQDGVSLHSGCVAFGLDRWVYALLSKFGKDLQSWPEPVRDLLQLPEGI